MDQLSLSSDHQNPNGLLEPHGQQLQSQIQKVESLNRNETVENSQSNKLQKLNLREEIQAGQIVEDVEPETQQDQNIQQQNQLSSFTPNFGPVPMQIEEPQLPPIINTSLPIEQQISQNKCMKAPPQSCNSEQVKPICLNEIKQRIVKIIPHKAGQIEDMSMQQICDLYEMIKDEQTHFKIKACSQQCHGNSLIGSQVANPHQIQQTQGRTQIKENANPFEASIQQIKQPAKQKNYTEQAFALPIRKIPAEQKNIDAAKQYPADFQMKNQLLDLIPQLRSELNEMGTDELKKTYDLALQQKKKIKPFSSENHMRGEIDQNELHHQNTVQKSQPNAMEVQNLKSVEPVDYNSQQIIKAVQPNQQTKINSNLEINLQLQSSAVDKKDTTTNELCNEQKNVNVDEILKAVAAKYPALQKTFKTLSKGDIISAYDKVINDEKNRQNLSLQNITTSNTTSNTLSHNIQQTQIQKEQISGHKQSTAQKESNTEAHLNQHKIIGPNKTLNGENEPSKKNNGIEGTVIENSQLRKVQSIQYQTEPNLKRSHDTMMSTNVSKTRRNGQLARLAQQKPSKMQQRKRLGKLRISELRKKLIAKSPELKNKIMQLTDQQMERIFMDCMNKQEDSKKTVQINSKQSMQNYNNGHSSETITQKELFKDKTDKSSTELIEMSTQVKKKRCRTMVLMHTEQDYSDDQQDLKGSKRVQVSEGESFKKCQCDCCKKNQSIPAIFKKIIDCYVKNSSQ